MIKIVVVMLCHLAGYADGHLSGNGVNIVKRSLPKEVYVSPETFMTTVSDSMHGIITFILSQAITRPFI